MKDDCTVNSYDDNASILRFLFTCFMDYHNIGYTTHFTHLSVSDSTYFFSGVVRTGTKTTCGHKYGTYGILTTRRR